MVGIDRFPRRIVLVQPDGVGETRAGLRQQFETSGRRADQLLLAIASNDAYRFVEIATK